jgi:hypothetical protein
LRQSIPMHVVKQHANLCGIWLWVLRSRTSRFLHSFLIIPPLSDSGILIISLYRPPTFSRSIWDRFTFGQPWSSFHLAFHPDHGILFGEWLFKQSVNWKSQMSKTNFQKSLPSPNSVCMNLWEIEVLKSFATVCLHSLQF